MSCSYFTCTASTSSIELADRWIESTLAEADVSCAIPFAFSCHELIINSVEASLNNPTLVQGADMRMMLDIREDQVAFSIWDFGGGLPEDMDSLHAIDDIDPLQERGRGLTLIKAMTDQFHFSAEADGSFCYTIINNL